MSREYIDSFEGYASADLYLNRFTASINLSPVISSTAARTGTKSLSFIANAHCGIYRNLSGNRSTVIVGGAWYNANLALQTWPVYILSDSGTPQITLAVDSAQKIVAYRGSTSGTLLGTSTATVGSSSTWIHIAAKVVCHPSAGSVEVRVNDVVFLNLTGINTITTANSYCNQIVMGYNALNGVFDPQVYLDDFFIFNGLGSTCNDFPGDMKVTHVPMTGNGSVQDFARLSGSSNVAMINEAAQDGDTSYNSSSTAGDVDLYTFGALSGLGDISCLQVTATMRKDDAGSRHAGVLVKSAGTQYDGAVDTSLSGSYDNTIDGWEVDPATGVAFTQSGLNAIEIGGKVIS